MHYSISVTAEAIMKKLDFVSIDKKQVTQIFCLDGSSDWFAILNVFDVSCWWWLQILNTWVIIIYVGGLSTEIDASLSNRKAISIIESKLQSVSFSDYIDDKTRLLEV